LSAPVTETLRSNSFNFVPRADVLRSRAEPCPLSRDAERLADTLAGVSPVRSVFVRLKDRMRLCVTDTRDFDERELRVVKSRGQLYADVSSKLAPDDFAADLKKLVLDSECLDCDLAERCPRAFAATSIDVFSADDVRVREILRRLEGEVLDVGAGHAPYAAELEPAVQQGRARYVAVDPDAERLALLSARFPWATTRVGTLGAAVSDGGRVSAVLFLRSVNHLPDPDSDLRLAAEVLQEGGTLLLVDDVPFGLVRSAEHAARAEAGPARFEHHRREGAAEVDARCSGLPLRLVERVDVGSRGSNQWLLHYEKRGK